MSMLAFTYNPAPGMEKYADQLPHAQKHAIGSDLSQKDRMSPVYRSVRLLVMQVPEFTHQPVYHSLLF